MTDKTRSQEVATDVAALLRARNPILWIVTKEEARVEKCLVQAAAAAGFQTRFWDIAQGATNLQGRMINSFGAEVERPVLIDIGDTLDTIRGYAGRPAGEKQERWAWIMRDLAPWLQGVGGAREVRNLRNLARSLPATPTPAAQAVIVLTPSTDIPPELAGSVTVIEWPMPDREEIGALLDASTAAVSSKISAEAVFAGTTRDAAIDAALGLSGEEAQACFSASLVKTRRIDPALVNKEKKRLIAREKVLEWFDPLAGGMDAVGGLEDLKDWLSSHLCSFSPEAREYGLPALKGLFFAGITGCGKSLTAKATATYFNQPLLRCDLNALKDKYVGGSEQNLRKMFRTAEAVAPCILWIDEVEKALAGAVQGGADGGVSSDALGALLSWMQEKTAPVFVIATANDITKLPPEFMRKGRFDELFWIDLPNEQERQEVVKASLRSFKAKSDGIDLAAVSAATRDFTGSEIASLIPEAMFRAFNDGRRPIRSDDLVAVASSLVPISKTMEKQIGEMRSVAKGKFRPASKPLEATTQAPSDARILDII